MQRDAAAGTRAAALALCLVAVAAPFLSVQFAPLADLPQQAAQIRLALEAGHRAGPPLQVEWIAPNRLSYALLHAAWALFDPVNVGRMAMLLTGLLWVAALHLLAAGRRRPPAAAVLAALFFFNHFVYWGFYNFAVGVPVFLLWVFLLSLPPPPGRRALRAGALCATSLLLLYAHSLFLGAGLAWFALRHVLFRVPARELAFRTAAIVPALALAAPTFVRTEADVAAAGFSTAAVWGTPLLQRLSPVWLVDQAFGALTGPLEPLVGAFLAAWAALGLWQHRGSLRDSLDRELLAAGAMCALLSLALPHAYTNTIYFAERWLPPGAALAVLALPAPRLPWRLPHLLPAAVAVSFCVATAVAWRGIEREDFSGLAASLAALPAEPRVLGLDFLKSSPRLKITRPFLQTFAYSQVVKGGELNFSFAEHATSLAVFSPHRQPPWTPGLEWYAERVRTSDLRHFTHVLAGGDGRTHSSLAALPALRPLTADGAWRLYAVRGS